MRKFKKEVRSVKCGARNVLRLQCSRSFKCLFSFSVSLSARICGSKWLASVPEIFLNYPWTYLCFHSLSKVLSEARRPRIDGQRTHVQKYRHHSVCGVTLNSSETHMLSFRHTPSHCTTWNVSKAACGDIKGSHQSHA